MNNVEKMTRCGPRLGPPHAYGACRRRCGPCLGRPPRAWLALPPSSSSMRSPSGSSAWCRRVVALCTVRVRLRVRLTAFLARRLFARLSRLGLYRSLLAAALWARSFLATGLWSEGSGLAARVRWELVRSHRWYEGSNSSKGASQRGAAKSLVVSGSSLRCKGSNNPEGASRCDAAGAPPPRLGRSSSRPLSEIRRDHPMFPMSTRHFPMSTRHFIV